MHGGQNEMAGFSIGEQFLLNDDSTLVFVDEFDRVLDGDDFAPALGVDQIDHVIEGRCFARASRTSNEDEAVWPAREIIDLFGKAQPFPGGDTVAAKTKAHFGMTVAAIKRHANAPSDFVDERDA